MPRRSPIHAPATDARAPGGAAEGTLPIATQRAGVMAVVPALLRELGADPERVLAVAGLPATALDHADNRIPVAAIDALFAACEQHTGCAHFGLLAGQRATLAHFGTMGELMACAPTVGEALRRFVVVQHLNSDMGAAFLLEDGDTATFGYALYQTDLRSAGQVYDTAMGVACSILRGLCRLHWTSREVLLSRPAPREPAPYRKCFGPRVRYDQIYSAVRFSARWLAQPTPEPDPVRYSAMAAALMARTSVELVPRLHRALRLMLIQGHASGDWAAQSLSLHRRTLNRRLREQGTTFRKLLDEARLDVARHLLLHTQTSMEEIASALCYADVSAFMHAFRRWTGTTPAQFRQDGTR